MEKIDERYFSKYVTAGATPSYKDTLAAAATTTNGETGTGVAASKGKWEGRERGARDGESEMSGATAAAVAVLLWKHHKARLNQLSF